jgi:hypothetical protein
MNAKTIIKDQSGAALVVALIMIVVLTLIGLASTFSSTFEISLSGNKRLSTDAFFNGESRMYSAVKKASAIDDPARVGESPLPVTVITGDSDLSQAEKDSGLLPQIGSSRPYVNRKTVIDHSQLNSQLPLPSGKILNDKTKVTLYHCSEAGGGGEGMGSTKADSYIIDVEGTDQIASSDQNKSTVHLRTKVLVHRPTTEESQ